jgi:hypothetical protein
MHRKAKPKLESSPTKPKANSQGSYRWADGIGAAMNMARVSALSLVAGALLLAGCMVTREPQLYPANAAAQAIGPLTAQLVGHGGGNGVISLTLPTGETLSGRYSINIGGAVGFGSLYGSVYGSGGYASGTAQSAAFSMPNGSPGVADMIGPKGTTAHCEFRNNNLGGHGNGVCLLSNGASYRMQY